MESFYGIIPRVVRWVELRSFAKSTKQDSLLRASLIRMILRSSQHPAIFTATSSCVLMMLLPA
jgi:hypothetical protein